MVNIFILPLSLLLFTISLVTSDGSKTRAFGKGLIPNVIDVVNSMNDPAEIREHIRNAEETLRNLAEQKRLLKQQVQISLWRRNFAIQASPVIEFYGSSVTNSLVRRISIEDDPSCAAGSSGMNQYYGFYDGGQWVQEEIDKLQKDINIRKRDLSRLRARLLQVQPMPGLSIERVR